MPSILQVKDTLKPEDVDGGFESVVVSASLGTPSLSSNSHAIHVAKHHNRGPHTAWKEISSRILAAIVFLCDQKMRHQNYLSSTSPSLLSLMETPIGRP
ncbi:hypothetical protein SISNIDRAFT_489033 [Sistotremastrum niveocremeum HHB9708]|uniref:Uncharacterized protein n=1 Tax=Sistotremastrum niveocremeum HHB9708 TaxID=1314777 RepID=A0A164QF22_9AGAM|nr:hypothetical protein SISNIDRAFT_489033 [Sistotremastrum niveocremeum HHB9708]